MQQFSFYQNNHTADLRETLIHPCVSMTKFSKIDEISKSQEMMIHGNSNHEYLPHFKNEKIGLYFAAVNWLTLNR